MATRSGKELAGTVKRSKAPAIARAAAVMRLLGKTDSPLSLQLIAKELDLVPSTCLYVLRALVEEQLVAVDPDTKRYTLAAGVMTLARHWLSRDNFAHSAQQHLDAITREFGVSSLGVQVFGLDHIVVVATAVNNASFQLSAKLGSRFPALISATGRCIAAYAECNRDELRNRFEELRWDRAPRYDNWLSEVESVIKRGYAIDDSNYIDGVTVVASPVWSHRGRTPSHALVAVGIGAALKKGNARQLGTAVREAAHRLSRDLGGREGLT